MRYFKSKIKNCISLILCLIIAFTSVFTGTTLTEAASKIMVNGVECQTEYNIKYFENTSYGFTTGINTININNLPDDGIHNNVKLYLHKIINNDIDNSNYYFANPDCSESNTTIDMTKLFYAYLNGDSGYQYDPDDLRKPEQGEYYLQYINDNNYVDASFVIEIDDDGHIGFVYPDFYNQNLELYEKEKNTSQFDLDFYKYYSSSANSLSGPEYDVVKKIVDTIKSEIVKKIPNYSQYQLAKVLHNFVASWLYYDYVCFSDPNAKSDTDVINILTTRKAVCAGYSVLYSAMLSVAGIPNRIIAGYGDGQGGEYTGGTIPENHAWNEVYLNNKWVLVDSTWDSGNSYEIDPGSGFIEGNFSEIYFDSSMEFFSVAHLASKTLTTTTSNYQHFDGENFINLYNNTEKKYYKFENIKGVPNGVSLSPQNLELPDTVTKVTPDGETTVPVIWLIGDNNEGDNYYNSIYFSDYNQSYKGYTTLTVYGAADYNFDNGSYDQISTKVTILDAAPSAPVLQFADSTSLTVKAEQGIEYSLDGESWQESPEFTGLSPNTSYNIYARKSYNFSEETVFPSTASTALIAKTLEQYTVGDINGDGFVNLKDSLILSQYIADWNVSVVVPALDYNKDSSVDLKDVIQLTNHVINTK